MFVWPTSHVYQVLFEKSMTGHTYKNVNLKKECLRSCFKFDSIFWTRVFSSTLSTFLHIYQQYLSLSLDSLEEPCSKHWDVYGLMGVKFNAVLCGKIYETFSGRHRNQHQFHIGRPSRRRRGTIACAATTLSTRLSHRHWPVSMGQSIGSYNIKPLAFTLSIFYDQVSEYRG